MVIDVLNNSAAYEALHPRLAAAFAYIRSNAGQLPPDGRYPIDGDHVYAMVQSYETQPVDRKAWESHRKYIDVQYIAEGGEAMGWAPLGSLKASGDYDPVRDYMGYEDRPATVLRCEVGTFVIFWPEDVHKPGCRLEGFGSVRKIVVKIEI